MTKPKSPEEIDFLLLVNEHKLWNGKTDNHRIYVRDLAGIFSQARNIPIKRIHYWLQKWTDKGWYNYGVSLDLGWLTDTGLHKATEYDMHRRFEQKEKERKEREAVDSWMSN